jgi:DNA-binding NtrC family response regulator
MAMAVSMSVAAECDVTKLLRLGLSSDDAHVLANARANVLIVAVGQTRENLLQAMESFLQPQGTLILRDIEKLDQQAQHELLRWLDGVGSDTRVISLTSARLYPLVQAGKFLDTLYYRLNIVRLAPVE